MKKIINPWRNHEGYNCFGCSPDNPIGLHLEFYEDGDYIVSTWHPGHNYQGWVDTMHGGILSTLIDEVCGWVVTRKLQTSGYTVQLNVKFRKAVPTTEPELTIRAKVTKQVRNLAYISAEITNSKGELCNEGEAIYFLMNEEKAHSSMALSRTIKKTISGRCCLTVTSISRWRQRVPKPTKLSIPMVSVWVVPSLPLIKRTIVESFPSST